MPKIITSPDDIIRTCDEAIAAGRETIEIDVRELRVLARGALERREIVERLRGPARRCSMFEAHEPVLAVQFLLGWFLGTARDLAAPASKVPEVACQEPGLAPSGNEPEPTPR